MCGTKMEKTFRCLRSLRFNRVSVRSSPCVLTNTGPRKSTEALRPVTAPTRQPPHSKTYSSRPCRGKWVLIIQASLFAAALGWQAAAYVASGEYSAALLVYPDAKGVRYQKVKGSDQLSYRVTAKFPGSGVIGWIAFKMEEMGWEPLVKDFLNPDLNSSHVIGWRKYSNETMKPRSIGSAWVGDWRNEAGDIVSIHFVYSYPEGSAPNLTEMNVLEIYLPAHLATQALDSIR